MPIIAKYLIFLLGLSFPFNQLTIEGTSRSFTLGFIVSVLYFLSMTPYLRKVLILRSTYGKTIFLPLLFLVLLTFANALHEAEGPTVPIFNTSIFLCCILMYVMLIHSTIEKDAMRYCLWGYAVGCFLVSVVFFQQNLDFSFDNNERTDALEENLNALGIFMSIGLMVILNDFIIRDKLKIGKLRFIFLIPFISMLLVLLATASRTAFLIFALSFIAVIFLYPSKNPHFKFLVVTIGIIFVIFITLFIINHSDNIYVITRLLETKNDHMSNRVDIWRVLLPQIFKHPILGVGETGYVDIGTYILRETNTRGDITYGFSPHNVLIEVALYTGFPGLAIWLFYWWAIFKRAIICYKSTDDYLPLLLLLPIIASVLSGQILSIKWAYMIYAFIFATFTQTISISAKGCNNYQSTHTSSNS